MDALEKVLTALPTPPAGRPALIAIDGAGGAGKSVLARGIAAARADVVVVMGDDFYGPEQRDWRSWTPRQGYERYFDHLRLEVELLTPLRRGELATFRRYDWHRHELDGIVRVAPNGLVVVEGVYLLRPRLRPYFDLTVFVDTPREERLRRMYQRGENEAGWIERWAAAEDYYLEAHPGGAPASAGCRARRARLLTRYE